jgi:hypothetical protein
MFELFSDIYFVVYKLYYVGQNDNLGIHVSLRNWDGGSSNLVQHAMVIGKNYIKQTRSLMGGSTIPIARAVAQASRRRACLWYRIFYSDFVQKSVF